MKTLQKSGGPAAVRTAGLPKGLNVLGMLTGVVGIISLLPGLTDLVALFGLSQLVWYAWGGIVLLRSNPVASAPASASTEKLTVVGQGATL